MNGVLSCGQYASAETGYLFIRSSDSEQRCLITKSVRFVSLRLDRNQSLCGRLPMELSVGCHALQSHRASLSLPTSALRPQRSSRSVLIGRKMVIDCKFIAKGLIGRPDVATTLRLTRTERYLKFLYLCPARTWSF